MLRTIALRITGTKEAKAQLEELGEDTGDFVVGTVSKLNEQVKRLTKTAGKDGVSLLDDNGNYRSTYEILQDIADIWEELEKEDLATGQNRQNALLEMLAGKNRSNILASILQSPDTLRNAYNSSLYDSEDSAQDELDKYLDSIEGKMQQFTNEVQEFWYGLVSSDTVKAVVDGATKIIDVIGNITSSLGELGSVIAAVGTAFTFHFVKVASGGILKKVFGYESQKDILKDIRDGKTSSTKEGTVTETADVAVTEASIAAETRQAEAKKASAAAEKLDTEATKEGMATESADIATTEASANAELRQAEAKRASATAETIDVTTTEAGTAAELRQAETKGANAAATLIAQEATEEHSEEMAKNATVAVIDSEAIEEVNEELTKNAIVATVAQEAIEEHSEEMAKNAVVANASSAGVKKQTADMAKQGMMAGALSQKFAGLKESLIGLATNPLTWMVVGLTALITIVELTTDSYDDLQKKASESAKEFAEAKSELDSLNSELETTQKNIEELESKDKLTFTEKNELKQLKKQNDELEKQIALQERVMQIKQNIAQKDAEKALNAETTFAVEYDDNGNKFKGGQYSLEQEYMLVGDDSTILKSLVGLTNGYKEKLKEEETNLKTALSDETTTDSEIKIIEENIQRLKDVIAEYEEEMSVRAGNIVTHLENMNPDSDVYKENVHALNMYEYMDDDEGTKNLKLIESYFDGSTKKNVLKERLLEVAKAKGKLGKVSDALQDIGIDLKANGIDANTLNKYFDELAGSASDAADEIERLNTVDGSVQSVTDAFETENRDKDWTTMSDYLSQAKDLYKKGKIGTDDFKTAVQFITPDIINADDPDFKYDSDAYVKYWKDAQDKVKRYFDKDNQLKSMKNFSDDLVKNNLAKKVGNEYVWAFKSSAEAADALGISLEATEVIMKSLESYGAEFDGIVFSGENIRDYETSLKGIKEIYESMTDGDAKDRLGERIEGWQEEFNGYQEDLSTLTEEQVVQIKFEYDLATILSEIDELQQLVNEGGSTEDRAALNVANRKYREKREEQTGYTEDSGDAGYKESYDRISGLQSQLKMVTNEKDKANIQDQIDLIYDVQNAFQDFRAAGGELDWKNYLNSKEAKGVLKEILKTGEFTSEELAKILGMDYEVELDANDNITPALDDIDKRELLSKECVLLAEDEATGIIELWNMLEANPKFTSLSAQDQASVVIAYWNSLTPEQKEAVLNQKVVAEDNASNIISGVDQQIAKLNLNPKATIKATDNASKVINPLITTLDNLNNRTVNVYVKQHVSTWGSPLINGIGGLAGTAHMSGTAYNSGSFIDSWINPRWKTKQSANALVGEEGMELVANGNRWWTVGDYGAEFTHIPKNSVVFNARQTKDLLTKGHITGRGKSYLSGTAYASGWNPGGGSSSSSSSNNKPSNGSSASTKENTSATKENTSALEDLKDWIEVLRDRIDRTLEQQKEYIDTLSHRNDQSREIDEYVAQAQNAIAKLQEAENYYLVRASQLGLSEAYVEKIQDGTIDIEQIGDEKLKEKVEQYQEWLEKAIDLQDQVHELNMEIKELRLQKFDNIIDDFDNLVSFHEGIIELNDAINSLSEKEIGVGNKDVLQNNLEQQKAIMEYRSQQVDELSKKLEDYVNYGLVTVGDEKWIEMNNAIREAQTALYDCQLEIWEIKDAIREVNFKELTDAIDDLEHAEDILSSIKDLMSDEGIFEKDSSSITKLGYTKLGLLSQQLLGSKKEVENYSKLIEALNEALTNGEITQADYNEQLKEYESAQMDAVNSVKDYKDAILDIVKNGIEKQSEAMDELIQKRKENLSLQKEYYDFQKEMNDKSKDMNSIRAQIAALEGDDSLEAEQKRKKLESQLKKLQEEYDETLKEHEFDTVQDAYDKLSDKVNENKDNAIYELETDLDAQNKAIAEILDSVRKNYSDVYNELNILSKEYGYNMSESLIKPWVDAENAMKHYIDVIGEKFYIKGKVENVLKNLQLIPDDSPLYGLINRTKNMLNNSLTNINVPNVSLPSGIISNPNVSAGDINIDINYTIDRVDKEVLPDLETILQKSTEHTMSVLKKYNRR